MFNNEIVVKNGFHHNIFIVSHDVRYQQGTIEKNWREYDYGENNYPKNF